MEHEKRRNKTDIKRGLSDLAHLGSSIVLAMLNLQKKIMVKLLYSKMYSHIFFNEKQICSFIWISFTLQKKSMCWIKKKKNISIICKNINFRNKLFNIRPLPIHHNASILARIVNIFQKQFTNTTKNN